MKKKQLALTATQKTWNWFFAAPFYGVPWLVWLYAFASMFVYMHASGPLTGHLLGFDDHVRMYQVLGWINGANWYDRTIMRANLPEGFHTIWPRIVDIPIAAVVIVAQQFTDQKMAALIASVVVPYTELIILFMAATYFVRPLVGKKYARLIPLFLIFTSILNQKKFTIAGFHPGQASHHSWYIILDVLIFGATARIALGVHGKGPACMLAAAVAVLLAVGIEGFPVVAGSAALLAVLSWGSNNIEMARRSALAFGYAALGTFLSLPLNQPLPHLFEISYAEPSIIGAALVGMAAAFLALETFVLSYIGHKKILSCAVLILLAGSIAFVFAIIFPGILKGLGGPLSPAEHAMALQQHPEAWALYQLANTPIEFLSYFMPIILAFVAAGFAIRSTTNRRRRILYLSYAGFSVIGSGMSQIYYRYYHHAMTTSCAWLLWAWQKIRQKIRQNLYRSLISLVAFVALGPLWMLILPAIETNAPFLTQVVFFPAKVLGPWDACDIRGIAPYLNAHYGTDKKIIMPETESAKFLYHTHLLIDFLANYPSHDRFIPNAAFFQTQDPRVAKAIAIDHQFDLVAICQTLMITPEDRMSRPQRQPMFMESLAEQSPPKWLKQVNTGPAGNYLLFQVDKNALTSLQGK